MTVQAEVIAEVEEKVKNLTREDLTFWAGNWIWRAVQCLVENPDFDPSPSWSAKRLGVGVDKVVEAFEGLERMGLIYRDGATFKVVTDWFQVTAEDVSADDMLAVHTKMAPQVLSKITTKDRYTVQFIPGDRSLVDEFTPRFKELFQEMGRVAEARKLKGVIVSQVSFAQVTNEGGV